MSDSRVISLGKYGSFPANQIIGRPYYATFEVLDRPEEGDGHALRILSAAELHTEALIADGTTPGEPDEMANEEDGRAKNTNGNSSSSSNAMRSNQNTLDDVSTQRMTMNEIEGLKQRTTGSGKEIITKLLESHAAIDQKTDFSRAKYMVRKRQKYLRRFTVLPMDTCLLTNWMLEEKGAARSMELRDEIMGLIGCWANVHYSEHRGSQPSGRWLVVDDTGGLVVAAMAERMGILYPPDGDQVADTAEGVRENGDGAEAVDDTTSAPNRPWPSAMSATHSTLTVIHPHIQANFSFLKYFSFDIDNPDEQHPLRTHLKTLSWLQLLDPQSDMLYSREPMTESDETLASWKSSKRGMYYRKHRRYDRVRRVVDETRAGGFDGLVVVSQMDAGSVLKHTVPLLAGSAPVVVYSPHIEPLVRLADLYSTARRAAYLNLRKERARRSEHDNKDNDHDKDDNDVEDEDFPLDPTLLLGTTVQTSRVRAWQVLPGRTHPMMTGRGGAEGYVFHGTRVIPTEDKVAARGVPGRKKRKVEADQPTTTAAGTAGDAQLS